jgi:hypothetical protein
VEVQVGLLVAVAEGVATRMLVLVVVVVETVPMRQRRWMD